MEFKRTVGGTMISDTMKDAELRQHEIFKRMSGEQRMLLAMAFSDTVRDLALAGLRSRHPTASEAEQRMLFIKEVHGVEIRGFSGDRELMNEQADFLKRIVEESLLGLIPPHAGTGPKSSVAGEPVRRRHPTGPTWTHSMVRRRVAASRTLPYGQMVLRHGLQARQSLSWSAWHGQSLEELLLDFQDYLRAEGPAPLGQGPRQSQGS